MSWIKIDINTPDKPEVFRVARILGVDRDLVVGKLIRLWAWFDINSVDGVVDAVVDADVDALVDMPGLTSALKSVGWFASDPQTERAWLPNFSVHNGESAKKRAEKTQRQAKWRSNKPNVDAVVDADVDALVDEPVSTTAPTREEKIREDISISPSMAPPTLEEVSRECKTKGYSQIDPPAWWGYWDSVGWRTKNGVQIKWQSRLMADNLAPKPEWHTRGRPKGSGSTSNRRNQGAVYDPNITTEQIAESFR